MSDAKLPDWPAAMTRETAAAYLSISPRKFGELVSADVIPGRTLGKRCVRYLRAEIDESLTSFPKGKGVGPPA